MKDRRHLQDDELNKVADGRVFTGRQGIDLKLVDSIGEESEAIRWLETEKKVAHDLPVRDWRPERNIGSLGFFGVAAEVTDAEGQPESSLRCGDLRDALQAAGRLLHRLGQHRAALAVAEVAPVAVAARIPGVT